MCWGIIRKTLAWYQILCIPYSTNLKILYQTSARWSASSADHHIWHTGTWLRGEYSGKYCSMSCNSIVLQVTNCRLAKNGIIRKLLIYLRVTEDMSTKLRKEHRSATDKEADCHRLK